MVDKRHALCNRIQSIKQWLTRAEDSFRQENDMRGELDLLLAEAELQRLREKEGGVQEHRRNILAGIVACCLAVAVLGGWYALKERNDAPDQISLPTTAHTVTPLNSGASQLETLGVKAPVIAKSQPEAGALATLASTASANDMKEVAKEEQPPAKQAKDAQSAQPGFSNSEMRDFVRTAGQTLRGK